MSSFSRENHYVPRLYLKRFSADDCVFKYSLLVQDARVPLWKRTSTKGIAVRTHLYTRIGAEGESDEIEKWLNCEFEDPAEEALHKATTGLRLNPSDWVRLARFVGAQDVRTLRSLSEHLDRANKLYPSALQNALDQTVQRFNEAKLAGETVVPRNVPYSEY